MISLIKAAVKGLVSERKWDELRGRWWRLSRPLLVDYCPVLLPWFVAPSRDRPVDYLHQLGYRFNRQDPPTLLLMLFQVYGMLVWPLRCLGESLHLVVKHGGQVQKLHGVSRVQQLKGALYHALRFNIPPASFYKYRLFDPHNAQRSRDYLHEEQMDILYPTLMHGLPSDVDLREKQRFFEHCRKHNLPTVEIIATFNRAAIERWYGEHREALPRTDLVLKPVNLACGQGFQRWQYDVQRDVWQREGVLLDHQQFIAHACQMSEARRHLLQPCITNHPALARYAPTGLCTIRIVSYRRVDGETGMLMAGLRMPAGASVVDNFAAGGLAAPIDHATGVVGEALAKYPSRGPFATHPDTGVEIAGITIPRWSEAVTLAQQAHATCPWLPTVGWDIVVTETGVCLLEANPGWCVELAQIATNQPLGATIYPDIFLEYLQTQEAPFKPAPSPLA